MIQVFWKARDPEHPAYDEAFARRYGTVIEDCCCRMDCILGNVLESAGEEAAALKRRICEMLGRAGDRASGRRVIERVRTREDLYAGPFFEDAPDLVVGFRPGYRASWQTAVGGSGRGLLEDNRESWSGDHVVAPSFVPGVFFASRPLRASEARACDAAVAIVRLLGLPGLPQAEGRGLFDG